MKSKSRRISKKLKEIKDYISNDGMVIDFTTNLNENDAIFIKALLWDVMPQVNDMNLDELKAFCKVNNIHSDVDILSLIVETDTDIKNP